MTTYGSLIGMNPALTGQQIFDAGVAEGLRRVRDGDYPKSNFSREEVEVHEKALVDAAIMILRETMQDHEFARHPAFTLSMAIPRIEGLTHGLAPRFQLRYSNRRMLPVCSAVESAPVWVWVITYDKPIEAFYGPIEGGMTAFYRQGGTAIAGVQYWSYREERSPE